MAAERRETLLSIYNLNPSWSNWIRARILKGFPRSRRTLTFIRVKCCERFWAGQESSFFLRLTTFFSFCEFARARQVVKIQFINQLGWRCRVVLGNGWNLCEIGVFVRFKDNQNGGRNAVYVLFLRNKEILKLQQNIVCAGLTLSKNFDHQNSNDQKYDFKMLQSDLSRPNLEVRSLGHSN